MLYMGICGCSSFIKLSTLRACFLLKAVPNKAMWVFLNGLIKGFIFSVPNKGSIFFLGNLSPIGYTF